MIDIIEALGHIRARQCSTMANKGHDLYELRIVLSVLI